MEGAEPFHQVTVSSYMSKIMEREPEQMHPNGSWVSYRRDDGRLGIGTVLSYNRESGQFRIQTKNGVVVRFWAGVQTWEIN